MARVQTIFRSKLRSAFTKMPNAVANDENLSPRALGALNYLLSKPPNWKVIPEQLANRFGISYRVALVILKELIKAGYLRRELVRDGRKISGVRYLVSDDPEFFTKEEAPAEPNRSENSGPAEIKPTNFRETDDGCMAHSAHAGKRTPYKEKKAHKPPFPKPLPPIVQNAASDLAMENAMEKKPAFVRDGGRWELEIARRIGPDGFNMLSMLSRNEVDHLIYLQKRDLLSDKAIAELRLKSPPSHSKIRGRGG